ncbi:MAG: DUF2807 domain-containing protein [Bacteroidales bacterium]|nr:DUF2807 domain-containing protein [Bacteroidales bacterium]
MKTIRILIALMALIVTVSGCVINVQDTISGNGKVVKQKRDLPGFTGIKASAGLDVYLTQGDTQLVEVEADENLQEWIRTEVNGGVLHIYSEKMIRMAKTRKVNITCKTIDNIDISSAAEITGINRFKTDKLDIDMSSAGELNLELDANEVNISMSSAGNAQLKGMTQLLKADLSSAGDLDAFELEAKKGDITVSSASTARVFVTEEARFRSSSAASIQYKGEPRLAEINTSSAGSVNKK